ncbi:MAG: hypothetical protein CME13_17565 [Gemmatimonadetes bacterium]|nr:hypothetical protein [Gemmatimonadota bacterium]MBU09763.1 hypothetical protein [Gemmatimonadota bacterium]
MAVIEKARVLKLQRLEADCFADNAASIALLTKSWDSRTRGSGAGRCRRTELYATSSSLV